MIRKLIPAFLLIAAAAFFGFAQIVKVTPKKTVYTRRGAEVRDYKKTFVVTYPLISGAIPLAKKKKLENTISYWRVFGTTLQENLTEYDSLDELSYEVNYNKNGILDIALRQDTSAAYPDQSAVNLVIDLKTGERVKSNDVLRTDSLTKLAKMVDAKLKTETGALIKSIDKGEFGENDKEGDEALRERLRALNFTAETFDQYSISDRGITIFYDAGFPHVFRAVQPAGRYFFTWAEVKPFIKSDGLLGKFVR